MAGMAQDEASPSAQYFSSMSLSPPTTGSPYLPLLRELKSEDRGMYLIRLLGNCADLVAAGKLAQADAFLEHISIYASPDGDSMQRIASHLAEALSRRILRSLPGVYRTLLPARAAAFPLAEAVTARRHFFDLCPFLHIAFAVSNWAIMDAMEEEKMIHIIDLHVFDPTQWISLLQALSNRRGGPPHLRITGVNEHKELLSYTATCLNKEAERLDIPFQFNPVVSRLDNLDIESLRLKTGEALAINSVLQLHSLLTTNDEGRSCRIMPMPAINSNMAQLHGVSQATLRELLEKEVINGYTPSPDSLSPPFALAPAPRMERFFAALQARLPPKVMVITEQESNHNSPMMNERFTKAQYFYATLFDCLESTLPRHSVERMRVEKLFGEEIKNIIACEGLERTERHEKLERWAQRLELAGFSRVSLSFEVLLQARMLLRNFGCEGYMVNIHNGCIMIYWQSQPLFSVSAWGCRR
ncbi:scarecrow-like protein 3 [Phoenix dactylifera]|uniref:Scarecrow-like protein 3 n=1 Tax=Phoenix dactylifera TaxID=42345 RepID=A0A8B7BXT0_PHODC|nr:scarecrow-like protein 3 [Phoenix dactylifera]